MSEQAYSVTAGAEVPVRLAHVTLRYGNSVALDDVTLEVCRGERVCVLGANGSGKSTLASVICGLLAPDEGDVELAGHAVCTGGVPDLAAYRDARRQLGLVFQNPDDQIVTSVVADDVAFGPENLGVPRAQISVRVARELRRVAMEKYAHADPSRLSGGQRQRVCIAGALAMEPAVLVLDEPSSLLDVRGRAAIMRVMGRLAAAGATLVHVTHFMDEALAADRVVVMQHGHVALEGTPDEVFAAKNAQVIEALGLEMPFEARLAVALRQAGAAGGAIAAPGAPSDEKPAACAACAHTAEPLAILARDLGFSYGPDAQALDGVSLEVPVRATTAIVGQTGSGKSTLLRLLCGLEAADAGSLTVCGINAATKRGRRQVRRAVGYVMQHPERQLFAQTVAEDVAFGPRNQGLSAAEVEGRVAHALDLVGLADRRDASPFELSGGQQRLAAIAGVLAMEPELLVLDEPTAGLDPRGRARLRALMADLAAHGVTLLQVTHSMEDAARADHVVVLDQSHVLAAGTPAEVFCPANEPQLTAVGLGLPRPLAYACEHALDARPLTLEALVAALRAQDAEEARSRGL
ncbi:MAG: energy-coupling factor transporter ATPase [Paratractidigestivibacter faecalis]|uniref:ABC transporter ATP-binding protein n=1 Tax=Paratractidigestivibacter faecalis TaxID=2292441 RepID=UPI002A91D2C4|nr:energy-coupling factor transporter ATPase [Paratractidigestivibacter faecalis]MDY6014588.1 energy-coupling factor transporter ATPase [Paratractidigestivibacter faecalis]